MLVRRTRGSSIPRRGRPVPDDRWRPFAWALAVVVLAATGATDSGPAAYALAGAAAEADLVDGDEGTAFDPPVHRLPSAVGDELTPWPEGPWSTLSDSLPELAPAPTPLPGTFAFASALDGVPPQAMAAYRDASDVLRADDPSCALDWSLLAGIGRVESDHGRYGGAVLGDDGVSRPAIIGIALDGRPGVARILDTDGGRLDGDVVFDRAVGPMQFIPGTWASRAADGDGDGVADPHDIADAALSAAQYLCAGDGDLSTELGARAALMRYNRSVEYGTKVLTFARAYRDGTASDGFGAAFAGLGRGAAAGPWATTPWRPGTGAGRPAWASQAPFATAPLGPLAGPVAAQRPFTPVAPAAHVDALPVATGVPAAPGRPVAAPGAWPTAPLQGPLASPTTPAARPSPTPPFVTPRPTPSPTRPSTSPAATPSPTTSPRTPFVKPTPSPSAPFVKPSPSPSPTKPAATPSAKPSPTKPATTPSSKPSPTKPATTPSSKPSPTKPSTPPSSKPSPTKPSTTPSPTRPSTAPSAKPSPTTTKAPTSTKAPSTPSARPSPSTTKPAPAPTTRPSPTTSPKPSAAPSPAKPSAAPQPPAAAPAPKPAPGPAKPPAAAPAPKPAPEHKPAPAPAAQPAPAPAKPPAAPPAPAKTPAAVKPTVPAAPPAATPGVPEPTTAPDAPGKGRPDTTGLDRAAEVKGSTVPGDHARGGGR